MKLILQATKKEKRIALIIAVIIIFIIYWYNKRYLYVLDAEFENGNPTSIILKTGFIFPVKKFIKLENGKSETIKLYRYKYLVKETPYGFDILLNNKKIHSMYPDAYYQETKKLPTGRVYL